MKKSQKAPISLRLTDDMESRLEKCAAHTQQKKHALAQAAIAAAVEAIERNDYRLVLPIEFDVRFVPVERKSTMKYSVPPRSGHSAHLLNEAPPAPTRSRKG